MRRAAFLVLAALLAAAPARAQQVPTTRLGELGRGLFERQAGVALAVQGLTTIPDGTASDIRISQTGSGDPDTGLLIGQIGAGFTWSEDFPLYMEGYLGYARYSPSFLLTRNGEPGPTLPVKWNTVNATIGLGWSFQITDRLQLRPVVNGTLGYVASDVRLGTALLEYLTGVELGFLRGGEAATGGYGGALVLAWYDYRAAFDLDIELRLSQMHVETLPVYSRGLSVAADFRTLGLWMRYRWPTGREAFGRQMRWVTELYHSEFLTPSQREVLGADRLTRIGGGIEADVGRLEFGALGLYLNRLRLMANIVVGEDVRGYSVGIGMSF